MPRRFRPHRRCETIAPLRSSGAPDSFSNRIVAAIAGPAISPGVSASTVMPVISRTETRTPVSSATTSSSSASCTGAGGASSMTSSIVVSLGAGTAVVRGSAVPTAAGCSESAGADAMHPASDPARNTANTIAMTAPLCSGPSLDDPEWIRLRLTSSSTLLDRCVACTRDPSDDRAIDCGRRRVAQSGPRWGGAYASESSTPIPPSVG